MIRFKRSLPSIVNPQNLSQGLNCTTDKLSDYCRFYGYDPTVCTEKTNFTCKIPGQSGNHADVEKEFHGIGFLNMRSSPIIIGVVIHSILTVLCFLFSSLFLILLLFRCRQLQYPVYKLIMQLSICYLLFSIAQCFTRVPLYLLNFNSDESTSRIPLVVEQLANFGAVAFYSLLTLNRFVIFVLPSCKSMFDGKHLYVTLGFGWLVSIVAALFLSLSGCKRIYDGTNGIYYDICSPGSPTLYMAYHIFFYSVIVLPFIDLIAYIIIGISIFASRHNAKLSINRTEVDLLIQSVVMVVLYTVIK